MVVHPRAHKLSESIIGPLSNPAVDGHALRPKANGLGLEVALLKNTEGGEKGNHGLPWPLCLFVIVWHIEHYIY